MLVAEFGFCEKVPVRKRAIYNSGIFFSGE